MKIESFDGLIFLINKIERINKTIQEYAQKKELRLSEYQKAIKIRDFTARNFLEIFENLKPGKNFKRYTFEEIKEIGN